MQTYRSLSSVLCFFLLAGCNSTGDRGETDRSIGESEVFVVGKVELVPPLRADEQDLKTGGSGRLKNRIYVFFPIALWMYRISVWVRVSTGPWST